MLELLAAAEAKAAAVESAAAEARAEGSAAAQRSLTQRATLAAQLAEAQATAQRRGVALAAAEARAVEATAEAAAAAAEVRAFACMVCVEQLVSLWGWSNVERCKSAVGSGRKVTRNASFPVRAWCFTCPPRATRMGSACT